jgi:hypothetical protein
LQDYFRYYTFIINRYYEVIAMSAVRFSFSKALITTTALAFISGSCLSSVAFAMEPDEDKARGVSAASSSKDLLDIVSPLENNPTIIGLIVVFLDLQSFLHMGETSKLLHQSCSNPALWDALFKRDLNPHPSLSLTELELKSPSHYYGLAYLLQEILLPQDRLGSEFTISKPLEWWRNMISQAFPENASQGNYLLGLVYETYSLNQDAFDAYKKAVDAGYKKAQFKVAIALYSGILGQDARPEQNRFEELKTRASKGDQDALEWLDKALYVGSLGQSERSEQERFEEFEEVQARANERNQDSQRWATSLCKKQPPEVQEILAKNPKMQEIMQEISARSKRDLEKELMKTVEILAMGPHFSYLISLALQSLREGQ